MKKIAFTLAALINALTCQAEPAPGPSYAGQESREVKALSSEDVQSYLSGKGMGLAKAAELNGYPGPSHVLALSEQLNLTPEQTRQTKRLFEAMEKNAISFGRPLVEEERKLDQLFASKTITPDLLAASLEHIARLQGKVRTAHLEAHLAQVRILTPQQVALYMQLRGYTSNVPARHNGHH
jgi:Spy/CpxP family protein refolding chaperone